MKASGGSSAVWAEAGLHSPPQHIGGPRVPICSAYRRWGSHEAQGATVSVLEGLMGSEHDMEAVPRTAGSDYGRRARQNASTGNQAHFVRAARR